MSNGSAKMQDSAAQSRGHSTPQPSATRIVIVGAGFSGIAVGIRLLRSGRTDFVILERADEVGGTWRDNSYPGAGCDIPSLLYSFSFAQNPGWSNTFGSQDEILDYLKSTVDRFGLREHIRFKEELKDASWDDETRTWTIATDRGKLIADILVLATGYLSDPQLPDVAGIEDFGGPMFHTAQWDHEVQLEGRDVAVVGTGASAIQLVPAIAGEVGHLTLYQRTPAWVNAKPDTPVTGREQRRRAGIPGYQRFQRNINKYGREIIALLMSKPKLIQKTLQPQIESYLADQIPDEDLRRDLTPDYVVGCKRILFSNEYYPALRRDNVEVVPHAVDTFRPGTAVAGGVERKHDVVIFATGFSAVDRAAAHLVRSRGKTLSSVWAHSMSAYVGSTVAGFPNLITMLGPNTALGHHSQTVMLEAQADYLVAMLEYMEKNDLDSVEVREDSQREYNKWLDMKLDGTVWQTGGCTSWYQDASGHNPITYPTYTWTFRRHLRRFRPEHYRATTPEIGARGINVPRLLTVAAEAR